MKTSRSLKFNIMSNSFNDKFLEYSSSKTEDYSYEYNMYFFRNYYNTVSEMINELRKNTDFQTAKMLFDSQHDIFVQFNPLNPYKLKKMISKKLMSSIQECSSYTFVLNSYIEKQTNGNKYLILISRDYLNVVEEKLSLLGNAIENMKRSR